MFKVEEQGPMSPRNGVYIVQGEMSLVVAALRRNTRGGSHSHQVRLIDLNKDTLEKTELLKLTSIFKVLDVVICTKLYLYRRFNLQAFVSNF